MSANSCRDNGLPEMHCRSQVPQSWQRADRAGVRPHAAQKNARQSDGSFCANLANSQPDNDMQTLVRARPRAISHNIFVCRALQGYPDHDADEKPVRIDKHSVARSKFVRWCKFNFVGGIGIAVQFAALFLLKGIFHFHYLAATAFAVEAAVMHNFVWHEQFTWADRVRPSWRRSLSRLVRFHRGNGAVSILGNLALMQVMVGLGHMNYLVANAIATALCSVVNFLVSDEWVFEK